MTRPADHPIRVCIADDHRMFVEAIQLILGATPTVEVLSVSMTGHDLVEAVAVHKPDVALADISMPGPPFQDMPGALADVSPATRLLALTMHLDGDLAQRVLAAGYTGYVVKDAAVSDLVAALDAVCAGEQYVSQVVQDQTLVRQDIEAALTPREISCLKGADQGLSNQQIAGKLGIRERTVKFHFENVFRKLGAQSRGEAVAIARRARILLP